ncbi:MAG: monofunctional biosynthetic peptidoglycan transglycosylase [Gammaproteobacteria bacterium]|nr:monofunctional biosynthetic peptidoglycan transglycosylase [Gammaproteobacteria bacterium]
MPVRRTKRDGRLRRLRRALLRVLGAALLLSVGVVLLLRWLDPPYSAVMLQRLLNEGAAQHQAWVDIERVAPVMALAVVAAEDQRFPHHLGFDTEQILAAVEAHLDGARLRGASTISQQVARNLFLWQGRSYLRKGLEAWFTVLIEALWGKRRILEMYLNFAETGTRRFGVALAARDGFGRTAQALSAAQAALIAAALPNPTAYDVTAPSGHLRERQRWILRQMRNLGGPAYLAGIHGAAADAGRDGQTTPGG